MMRYSCYDVMVGGRIARVNTFRIGPRNKKQNRVVGFFLDNRERINMDGKEWAELTRTPSLMEERK